MRELELDATRDEPLLFDIIELRRFAEAKHEFDAAAAAGKTIANPTDTMRTLMELEYRVMLEGRGRSIE